MDTITEKDPKDGVADDDTRVSRKKFDKLRKKYKKLRRSSMYAFIENELMKIMLSRQSGESGESSSVGASIDSDGAVRIEANDLSPERLEKTHEKIIASAIVKSLYRGHRVSRELWVRRNDEVPSDLAVLVRVDGADLCAVQVSYEILPGVGFSLTGQAIDGEGMADFIADLDENGFVQTEENAGATH